MPGAEMPPVVTLAETKQLYWFCHGSAITDVGVRQRLRRAWGFCPRHTWLLFCVEHELRYLPLGAAKIYQDLTWTAAVLLGGRHTVTHLRRSLAAHASCLTCDYLARGPSQDPAFTEGRESTGVAAPRLSALRDCATAHAAARPAVPIAPDRERDERAAGGDRGSARPAGRAAVAVRQIDDLRRTASHAGQRRGLDRGARVVRRVAARTPLPDGMMPARRRRLPGRPSRR